MFDHSEKIVPVAARLPFALCLALISAIWMFWFSGYMLLSAGEVTALRSNFLFNADTPVWIERIDRVGKPFWTEFSVSHPLRPWLWGLPARALAFALGHSMDHATAAVSAAKILNSCMFGLAIGSLVLLGMRFGLGTAKIIGLVGFFCLFSANVVVGSTDHFGISIALMIVSVTSIFLIRHPKSKLVAQLCLAFVIFGTTVTNLLVPILSACFILKTSYGWDVRRLLSRRVLTLAAVFALAVVVAAFVWRRGYQGGSIILNLLNFRWINDPLSALQYAVAALIYPVVAPIPFIGEHGITLEPVTWSGWSFSYCIGAIAWLLLLGETLMKEWRRPEPSFVFWILLPWILFNIVFHNIWGDEYFLFTPHWSWVFIFCAMWRLRSTISWIHLGAVVYIVALQAIFFIRVHGLLSSV